MSELKIKFPQKAMDVALRPIPEELTKTRSGGRGMTLTYLSGSTVIDMLNESFGYLWNWEVINQWVQESVDKFNPKYDKEPVPQNPVAHVHGRVTVLIPTGDGYTELKKDGFGSKTIIGGQSDQEHIFKAAGTDALKKAASLFGIGLELHRDEEEQEYFEMSNYEDPWTDEALEEHEESRDTIRNFMDTFGLDENDMASYISAYDDDLQDMGDILPDNIEGFANYLVSLANETEGSDDE